MVHLQSSENKLIRQIEINANFFVPYSNRYDFLDVNNQIIACFPIEKTIIFKITEIKNASN